MKAFILGSNGMLGKYLKDHCISKEIDFIEGNRSKDANLDFLKPDLLLSELEKNIDINCLINCCAVTSFDFCEHQPEIAMQVNAITPSILAQFCNTHSIKYVHISTDHFYTGKKEAHLESEKISILNQYAYSKREAEIMIQDINRDALIARTAIIGRKKDQSSFLDWLFHAAYQSDHFNLFTDAYTSFIHCSSFANILFDLINKDSKGIINIASSEVFSKADFCMKLFEKININPNFSLASVTKLQTKRANSCGLSIERLQSITDISIPSMEETLKIAIEENIKLIEKV